MATYEHIAIGARATFAYAEEAEWAVPELPNQRVDIVSEGLANEIGNLISNSQNPTRGIAKRVRGNSAIGGPEAFEQTTEGFEVFYKHALGDAISMEFVDGGIRTRLTADHAAGVSTLNVEDSSVFQVTPGATWGLTVVYKDSDDALQSEVVIYSALASGTTITVTPTTNAFQQGAWVFQSDKAVTQWAGVYTHYIEAAATLPVGLTLEDGRDIVMFIYTGCKVESIENTFTAGEILTGTWEFLGRAEYSGADLLVATTTASTTLQLKNYALDYVHAAQPIGYAFAFDTPATPYTDYTTEANDDTVNDVVMLPAAVAASDAFYFGSDEQFTALEVVIGTAAAAPVGWTVDWEYYNGSAWVALTFTRQQLTTLEEAAGTYINAWDAPSDWTQFAVDPGGLNQNGYWIRANLSAATSGAGPLASRMWLGPGIVGFNRAGGDVLVGTDGGVTYTGLTVGLVTPAATLTGVSNWATGSVQAIGSPVTAQDPWDTPAAPPNVDPLSSFEASVYMDGVTQEALSANYTLSNNHNADKYQLGSRYRAGLPEQRRTVEGSLNAEFDDMIIYHKFINGESAFLEIRCVQDTVEIQTSGEVVYRQKHILFPNIEFTGTTPNTAGSEQIVTDFPFTALQDADNNMNEMAVIFVNTQNRAF